MQIKASHIEGLVILTYKSLFPFITSLGKGLMCYLKHYYPSLKQRGQISFVSFNSSIPSPK